MITLPKDTRVTRCVCGAVLCFDETDVLRAGDSTAVECPNCRVACPTYRSIPVSILPSQGVLKSYGTLLLPAPRAGNPPPPSYEDILITDRAVISQYNEYVARKEKNIPALLFTRLDHQKEYSPSLELTVASAAARAVKETWYWHAEALRYVSVTPEQLVRVQVQHPLTGAEHTLLCRKDHLPHFTAHYDSGEFGTRRDS